MQIKKKKIIIYNFNTITHHVTAAAGIMMFAGFVWLFL